MASSKNILAAPGHATSLSPCLWESDCYANNCC